MFCIKPAYNLYTISIFLRLSSVLPPFFNGRKTEEDASHILLVSWKHTEVNLIAGQDHTISNILTLQCKAKTVL
ncbi:hypothetical protein SAMN05216311_10457 [Chitinophaga sp. CF418]|nr:hypothetical protein SAMN05216311_10457 [Chitinophaga sp. CF418]